MQNNQSDWEAFSRINENRRAIRQFSDEPVSDQDMQAILKAAQLAPSSFNLQLYTFHWVKSKDMCKQMAVACEGQRAATSATAFVVIEAQWKNLVQTYDQFLTHVDNSGLYDERSRQYYHGRKKQLKWFVRLLPLWVFSGLKKIIALYNPYFRLAPLGRAGLSHWASRSSIYAAQNLLLAATARGLDTCPMEGFKPRKVARLLGIKRSSVIPIVIAVGHAAADARKDPRWRLPLEQVMKIH